MTDETEKPHWSRDWQPRTGRPTIYSNELTDEICQRMTQGQSITKLCGAPDMPSPATIYRWLREYPEFRDNYAKAQADRAAHMADEIIDIADESGFDATVVDGRAVVNGEAIGRARLRVDTRKWLMSKMDPKRYSDRVAVGGDPDAPPIQVQGTVEIVLTGPKNAGHSDAS